jgi:preprotein translocase subunit SecA
MFKWLGGLIDSNEKELERLQSAVNQINGLEADYGSFRCGARGG